MQINFTVQQTNITYLLYDTSVSMTICQSKNIKYFACVLVL